MKILDRHPHAVFHFITLLALGAGLVSSRTYAATINMDPAYGKWDPTSILYCLDSAYTPTEVNTIKAAIAQIMSDAPFIAFKPISCEDSRFKVRITPIIGMGAGSPAQPLSYSFPGRSLSLYNQGAREQIVSIARDVTTAPTGAILIRPAMKTLVNLLGLRNEHQRGDRDTYLSMHPDRFQVASAYVKYTPTQASWSGSEFDYCSITLNTPTDYSIPSTKAFDYLSPPMRPGMDGYMLRPELSRNDVNALAAYYGIAYSSPKGCCPAVTSCLPGSNTTGSAKSSSTNP